MAAASCIACCVGLEEAPLVGAAVLAAAALPEAVALACLCSNIASANSCNFQLEGKLSDAVLVLRPNLPDAPCRNFSITCSGEASVPLVLAAVVVPNDVSVNPTPPEAAPGF